METKRKSTHHTEMTEPMPKDIGKDAVRLEKMIFPQNAIVKTSKTSIKHKGSGNFKTTLSSKRSRGKGQQKSTGEGQTFGFWSTRKAEMQKKGGGKKRDEKAAEKETAVKLPLRSFHFPVAVGAGSKECHCMTWCCQASRPVAVGAGSKEFAETYSFQEERSRATEMQRKGGRTEEAAHHTERRRLDFEGNVSCLCPGGHLMAREASIANITLIAAALVTHQSSKPANP